MSERMQFNSFSQAMRYVMYKIASEAQREAIPRWKWWQIGIHAKADWRRYRRAVEAKRRRNHYEYVNSRESGS